MSSMPPEGGRKAPTRRQQHRTTDVLEKDDIEQRLEKALFGDEAGFLDSLSAARHEEGKALQLYVSGSELDSASEQDEDLGDVPDEDLFFLDAGTDTLPAAISEQLDRTGEEESSGASPAAWYDSDDDRLTISLATHTRLRKLRDTEADDVITGREYGQRLRRQYERLHPAPEWLSYARRKRRMSNGASHAESDSDVSMDESDSLPPVKPLAELLRSVGSLTRTSNNTHDRKRRKLRSEVIDVQRTKDVTPAGPSSIDTLEFHSEYPLLLAGGPCQTLTLYHVSPQPPNPNPVLTSLHVKGSPLHTASFCTPAEPSDEVDETRVFFSSRRRYFHTWSLSAGTVAKVTRPLSTFKHDQRTTEHFKLSPCGRYMGLISSSKKGGGSINVLSTTSMQLVCSCRVDAQGGVSDFDWWRDGEGFAVVAKNGEVSEYSVAEKRIIERWWDEGSVGTTVISIGGEDSRWIAIGSSSGIVNIYDRKSPAFSSMLAAEPTDAHPKVTSNQNRPSPARSLDQLTTPISHLVFSPDGQMLAMASRWKKDALRLVHLPSCTVYRNWPTDKTPLGRVSSLALGGRNGEWLAVGNEQGGIRLWEIRD